MTSEGSRVNPSLVCQGTARQLLAPTWYAVLEYASSGGAASSEPTSLAPHTRSFWPTNSRPRARWRASSGSR